MVTLQDIRKKINEHPVFSGVAAYITLVTSGFIGYEQGWNVTHPAQHVPNAIVRSITDEGIYFHGTAMFPMGSEAYYKRIEVEVGGKPLGHSILVPISHWDPTVRQGSKVDLEIAEPFPLEHFPSGTLKATSIDDHVNNPAK